MCASLVRNIDTSAGFFDTVRIAAQNGPFSRPLIGREAILSIQNVNLGNIGELKSPPSVAFFGGASQLHAFAIEPTNLNPEMPRGGLEPPTSGL